jgi:hypothetical protein
MKKIHLTLCMLLITSYLMAQQGMENTIIKQYGAVPVKTKTISLIDNSKGLGDTAGFSSNYMPAIVQSHLNGGYGLTVTGGGKIGYWWGTSESPADTAKDVWIQCYESLDGMPLHIVGIGFYCINKTIMTGDGTTDTLMFSIQKILSNGCGTAYNSGTWTYGPGPKAYLNSTGTNATLLTKTKMTVAAIDTSIVNGGPVFNYMALPSPITVTTSNPSSMFAVAVDFFQARMKGDTVYLICDDQNDGLALKYSQSGSRCPNGNNYYYPVSNFFTYNGSDGGLDDNGALFAVMSPTTGMNETFINGMKLGVRNTHDGTFLDYAIQSNSNVTFKIHDIMGRFVKGYSEGNKASGEYSFNLNTRDMAPGEYIVIMNACGRSLAKQIIIQ